MGGAKSDEVRRLLKRGLNHYGLGDLDAAIACWEHAQRLDPESRAAADYLVAARSERGDPPAEAAEAEPAAAPKAGAQAPARSRNRADDDATPRTLEGPLPPAPDMGESDDAVKAALADYKAGRLDEAWEVLARIAADSPDRLDVQGYLVMIRSERAKSWAKIVGDQGRALRLKRPMAELMKKENLAPDEGYLLSQIDGTLPIDQLISLSKTERVRTLEILAKLLTRGYVE